MPHLAFRTLRRITHPRIMILRTVLLLGLGAAQPVGLAMAAGPLLIQADGADATVSPREKLGRDLASWRVDVITQGEAPAVLASLQALVARGEALVHAAPEDEAGVELLTDLYVEEFTQAERRLGLGALRALFLQRLRAAHDPEKSPVATAIARASTAVVTVARIEQLIGTALSTRTEGDDGIDARRRLGPQAQMLSAAVDDAIQSGDEELVMQLGLAAAEPLAQAALKLSGERTPDGHLDPLELLVTVDPKAALDVALAHVQSEDLLLKVRVVDAFSARDPFLAESVWEATPSGDYELVEPNWAEIVVGLYRAPAVPLVRADRFLRTFARRGYAPLGLQALLPASLTRLPLGDGPIRPVAMEAAQELLASADLEEQRAGLKLVLLSSSVDPAWALAKSPRSGVRELLAKAFGPRRIGGNPVAPTVDAAYRGALATFLQVKDDGLFTGSPERAPVVVALTGAAKLAPGASDALVEAGSLIALLEQDPAISPAAFQGALLHVETLAERDRSLVLEAATRAVLRAIKSGDTAWGAQAPSVLQALLGTAVEVGEAEAFIGVFDSDADADAWRQAIEVSRSKSNLTRFSPHLAGLSPELQMKMVRALWRTGYDHFDWFDEDELTLRRDHWLQLASDKNLPHPARIWALEAMAGEDGSPAPNGAAAQLAGIVADLGTCPIGSRQLASMGLDPEEYLNHLLDLPQASDEAVLGVFIDAKDDATIQRLLDRFPASTWSEHRSAPMLSSVISALVKRRDPALNTTLVAANIRRTPVQSYLVRALNAERFAGHLPLGGAILKTGVMEQDVAIEYVASFMTDDAARYLVEAMETAHSESFRDQLFAALQGLTERREVAERWMRSSDAAARREAAVVKLLAVIDASTSTLAARSEAIKGLGLLDARDELPRLILLLESENEGLRTAAREAIDRMGQ